MLISDSHQFIFVHIRKAAGTSLRNLIEPYCLPKPQDLWSKIMSKSGIESDYQKFRFRHHSDIAHLEKMMPQEVFEQYFKFAIVRNPWKRLVSEYEYLKKNTSHGRHKKVSKMTFTEYIPYQAKRGDAHQINMLANKDGKLLMDFIGKMEHLEADWKHICEQIKIPHTAIPKLNTTKKVDYNQYYTEKDKALVAKLWKKDIETFEYQFED